MLLKLASRLVILWCASVVLFCFAFFLPPLYNFVGLTLSIQRNPEDAQLYLNRARIGADYGFTTKSLSDLTVAIELLNSEPENLIGRGEAYLQRARVYSRLLMGNTQNRTAKNSRGYYTAAVSDCRKAESSFKEADFYPGESSAKLLKKSLEGGFQK
ncbi:MAG: hypothetical protein AAFN40_11485 [Cyanobacteria bacterium J06560_6]